MGLYNYSIKPGAKDATAQGHDWDASYKDLSNVCRTIKRKSVTQTRKILDEALSKKKAIPYTFHNKGTGHRSELGGKKGRYPQKECRLLRNLLENAVSNAMQKGLDESKLYVKHAAANKLRTHKRYRRFWATSVTLGYGKQAVWANYQTCRAEIILSEREQKTKTSKKKGKKQESKPAEKKAGTKPKEEKAKLKPKDDKTKEKKTPQQPTVKDEKQDSKNESKEEKK